MGNVYDDDLAVCPYYVGASRYSIRCEGLVEGTELLTKFKDVSDKRKFQKIGCFQYPNECPVAMEHDRKWKDKQVTRN